MQTTTTHTDKQQPRCKRNSQQITKQQTEPVSLYLDSLANSGRRSVISLLNSAAKILGFEGQLESMPWQSIEYLHIAKIRNTLNECIFWPNLNTHSDLI